MKKLNLLIIVLTLIITLTSMNVQADTMGFDIKCNGEEEVYQTFTGDILKCDIYSTGTGIYNFKTVIISYDIGTGFKVEKFVPSKEWDDTLEKEEGIILSSNKGVPLNRNFGTMYVKVNETQFGKNSFEVALGENETGESIIKYDINIHEANENRLESVKINNDNLKINFNSDITEYNLTTTEEKANFDLKTKNNYSLTDVKQSYSLNYGTNVIKIKVTDSKGDFNKSRIYTFNIKREDNRSDINTLKKITICDKKIDIKENTFDYTVEVPYETDIAKFDYELNDKKAKTKLEGNNNLIVGKNDFKLTVTSEKGNKKTYNIYIIRANKILSDNNKINNVEINNYNINFNKDTYNYTLKIGKDDKLDIKITLDDENANYQILGNEKLENGKYIYINVTSESGKLLTYSILIEKSAPINYPLIFGISLIVIGLIPLIIIIINKMKKTK